MLNCDYIGSSASSVPSLLGRAGHPDALDLPPSDGAVDEPAPSAPPAALERSQASILSPLRYVGSKRRLAGYIKQVLKLNELRPSLFVEPFGGGFSVSLQLLNDGSVERVGFIDRDPLVASFWQSVFFDSDWLVEQVETIPVTLDQWNAFKAKIPTTRRERAIACLFLNRTSFSGILAPRCGPLGGQKQLSANKLDCRFPRATLVKRIRQAAALKSRVAFVWNYTWERGMGRLREMQGRGRLPEDDTFYYLDPPFFEKAERLYNFYFDDSGHRKLRDFILTLESPWILSYDSVQRVSELYGEVGQGAAHVELLYSTSVGSGRGVAQEVLLSNLDALPTHTRLWRRSEEWRRHRVVEGPLLNGNGTHQARISTSSLAHGVNGNGVISVISQVAPVGTAAGRK